MKALFDSEAWRNHVYPLLPLRHLISRPEDARTTFVYRSGVDRLQDTMNPRTGAGVGYTIRADVENPSGKAEGVIIAQGSRYGGFTLFVKNKHIHFEINSSSHNAGELVSKRELPAGHSMIVVNVIPEPAKPLPAGASPAMKQEEMPFPGKGTLDLNGSREAATNFLNVPAGGGYWSAAESLDVGSDLGSAVSNEYTSPNRFTGTINSVTLELHKHEGQPTNTEKAARNDGHS